MVGVEGGATIMCKRNFWLLGGDLRQEKLAGLLRQDGHEVHTYALGEPPADLDGLRDAHCVVLPLPVSIEGGTLNSPMSEASCPLEDIFARLAPRQFLCGGMVKPEVEALATRYGLTLRDYFQREELAVANAVPAALAV